MLITATMMEIVPTNAPLVGANKIFMEKACAKIGWLAPFYISNVVDKERVVSCLASAKSATSSTRSGARIAMKIS
jgi:hypothetical protein